MVLLGNGAQVEARFGLFGDSFNLDARYIGAQFAWNVPYARKSIWTHPMELLDDMCYRNLSSVCLEIMLILMQDRCMLCMEHTICLEINLDATDGPS